MRYLYKPFLLCGLLFLCSCSVLKKSKESHLSSTTEVQQGSQTSSASVDTTKKVTTEHWKITVPASFNVNPADLPKFEPLPAISLSGASKEQAAAVTDMQVKYSKLLTAYNDQGKILNQSESFGHGLLFEIDRKIEEKNGKSTSGKQQDSLKVKTGNQVDNLETSKQVSWYWLVGGLCLVILALFIANRLFKP
jgi:hypothetical protein